MKYTIPPERLALLGELTLYGGFNHSVGDHSDCRRCARELLHEVVTGLRIDRTPPGVTALAAILPHVNDGPWRDDARRTAVLRPYLPAFLPPTYGGIDQADDERRVCALLDHAYRKMAPDVLDLLYLKGEAATLRAIKPIVDFKTARAALEEGNPSFLAVNRASIHLSLVMGLDIFVVNLLRAISIIYPVVRAVDCSSPRIIDYGTYATALGSYLYADALSASTLSADEIADRWENSVRELLDRVCSISISTYKGDRHEYRQGSPRA